MTHALIFDFDGTLADSYHAVMAVVNQLADRYGFKKITAAQLPQIRGRGIRELLAELQIPARLLPKFVRKARALLKEKIETIQPFHELNDQLDILHQSGFTLGILTTNSKQNVNHFLELNKMKQFSFIEAGASLFGKAHLLSKLIKRHRLEKDSVIYVGDEARDLAAAQSVGVKSIAVTWGFSERSLLEKEAPTYIISEPGELLTIVSQL